MASEVITDAMTSCTVRVGYRNGDPMTLAELRDAIAELLAMGYDEDTKVQGSSGLTLFQRLPLMTPAQVRELVGGGA
ncbi:MAG: hypothetical protein BGO38_07850 [Cellulomonas sp. 73-145]|uniref:hypothetical protein n=1 Tax=Cellulomonas sp. 73-145 TaxID=1895739 RepID=UPI00092B0DDD|nr:hypothetical protein [Cellulomonas sp. 73-145]OJV58105.1 MAG: hypothetical protein BGO38_07850 [Cellulomonas sp. 73-145]